MIGCKLQVASSGQPTTNNSQPTTDNSQPTTKKKLPHYGNP